MSQQLCSNVVPNDLSTTNSSVGCSHRVPQHKSTAISSPVTEVMSAVGPVRPHSSGPRRLVAKPTCTHVDMDRLHGRHQCEVCYRFPSMGWVYVCRQDERAMQEEQKYDMDAFTGFDTADKSPLRIELEAIGLSDSVIELAENNFYTTEQLDMLIAQKLRVKQMIANTMMQTPAISNECAVNGLGTESQLPINDGTSSSTLQKRAYLPSCTLKACHTCRPYYRDRIYMSFAAIFADEVPALTQEDNDRLTIVNAEVLRTIGLRKPAQKQLCSYSTPVMFSPNTSQGTMQTTESEIDDLNQTRAATDRFYKVGSHSLSALEDDFNSKRWRSSLKYTFQNVFRSSRESSSEGSNITLPLPRTGTHRTLSQTAGEFDLSMLKRLRSHKQKIVEADSSGDYIEGFVPYEIVGSSYPQEDGQDTSDSSVYSFYSGVSETGSEVEVNGGVALTEEGVEKHTPDIITTTETADSVIMQA